MNLAGWGGLVAVPQPQQFTAPADVPDADGGGDADCDPESAVADRVRVACGVAGGAAAGLSHASPRAARDPWSRPL